MAFVISRGGVDPFTELERFRREMSRMLEARASGDGGAGDGGEARRWHPRANVHETADDVRVSVPLPGVDPARLEVAVEGGVLRIAGERPAPELSAEAKEGSFVRAERIRGPFLRRVELPVEVEADKVEASYRQGVLEVVLPKAAAARPRRIQVRSES